LYRCGCEFLSAPTPEALRPSLSLSLSHSLSRPRKTPAPYRVSRLFPVVSCPMGVCWLFLCQLPYGCVGSEEQCESRSSDQFRMLKVGIFGFQVPRLVPGSRRPLAHHGCNKVTSGHGQQDIDDRLQTRVRRCSGPKRPQKRWKGDTPPRLMWRQTRDPARQAHRSW